MARRMKYNGKESPSGEIQCVSVVSVRSRKSDRFDQRSILATPKNGERSVSCNYIEAMYMATLMTSSQIGYNGKAATNQGRGSGKWRFQQKNTDRVLE